VLPQRMTTASLQDRTRLDMCLELWEDFSPLSLRGTLVVAGPLNPHLKLDPTVSVACARHYCTSLEVIFTDKKTVERCSSAVHRMPGCRPAVPRHKSTAPHQSIGSRVPHRSFLRMGVTLCASNTERVRFATFFPCATVRCTSDRLSAEQTELNTALLCLENLNRSCSFSSDDSTLVTKEVKKIDYHERDNPSYRGTKLPSSTHQHRQSGIVRIVLARSNVH